MPSEPEKTGIKLWQHKADAIVYHLRALHAPRDASAAQELVTPCRNSDLQKPKDGS